MTFDWDGSKIDMDDRYGWLSSWQIHVDSMSSEDQVIELQISKSPKICQCVVAVCDERLTNFQFDQPIHDLYDIGFYILENILW